MSEFYPKVQVLHPQLTNEGWLVKWIRDFPDYRVKCLPTAEPTRHAEQKGTIRDVKLMPHAKTILIRFYGYPDA